MTLVINVGCNLRDLVESQPIEMKDLSGQRIAVDVFLNAYQFITSMTGEDGKPLSYNGKPVAHLMGFLDRTTVLISEGIDPVLFGLTDKDFQLIAKNFAQIRNQLKVTNELLDKYKEYYEGDLDDKDEK